MFIAEYLNTVDAKLCENIIARFEKDPRRKPGTAYVNGQALTRDACTGIERADPGQGFA
jgi:hypothetical protein